jgi:hypothetical protein
MYLSSAANGSQGLKKKLPIRTFTIALFVLGALLAIVMIYQQFTTTTEQPLSKPYAISREEAMQIALIEVDKESDRDAAFLPNEQAIAKLIHVVNDGIGFVVDENFLSDMWLYTKDQRFLDIYENNYIWHVDVRTYTDDGDSRGYWYLVDANNGKVIGSDRDYAAFKAS